MEELTIEQINQLYPREWVVIGCTHCENGEAKKGVVLVHSSDTDDIYWFLVQQAQLFSSQFPLGIVIRYANVPAYPEVNETNCQKEE